MATISLTEKFDFKQYKVLFQLVRNRFVSFLDKISSNISTIPDTNKKVISVFISGNASSEVHKIRDGFMRGFRRILPERSQVVASDRQYNIILLTRFYADYGAYFIWSHPSPFQNINLMSAEKRVRLTSFHKFCIIKSRIRSIEIKNSKYIAINRNENRKHIHKEA